MSRARRVNSHSTPSAISPRLLEGTGRSSIRVSFSVQRFGGMDTEASAFGGIRNELVFGVERFLVDGREPIPPSQHGRRFPTNYTPASRLDDVHRNLSDACCADLFSLGPRWRATFLEQPPYCYRLQIMQ